MCMYTGKRHHSGGRHGSCQNYDTTLMRKTHRSFKLGKKKKTKRN